MKYLFLISFISLSALAEAYEYKIEGMTCQGCKSMIKAAICELPGIKTCDVQIGSMKLEAEDGKTIDQDTITKALDDLNTKYKENYKIGTYTKIDESTAKKPIDKKVKK